MTQCVRQNPVGNRIVPALVGPVYGITFQRQAAPTLVDDRAANDAEGSIRGCSRDGAVRGAADSVIRIPELTAIKLTIF